MNGLGFYNPLLYTANGLGPYQNVGKYGFGTADTDKIKLELKDQE